MSFLKSMVSKTLEKHFLTLSKVFLGILETEVQVIIPIRYPYNQRLLRSRPRPPQWHTWSQNTPSFNFSWAIMSFLTICLYFSSYNVKYQFKIKKMVEKRQNNRHNINFWPQKYKNSQISHNRFLVPGLTFVNQYSDTMYYTHSKSG